MTTENITFQITDESIAELPHLETTDFGFTRYLYIIDDVKSSLVISILEKNREEALFWAYELYFSGFKDHVFHMLEMMVTFMYSRLNPRLPAFLEKKKKEWEETHSYCIIGTFIYNMINRPYDITEFVKQYSKDPDIIQYVTDTDACIEQKTVSKNNIYINVEQKDVIKYITVNNKTPRDLLKKTVKYPVRKNTLAIFDHEHGNYSHQQLQSLYWYYWLYYASVSQIWGERIAKYGGVCNNDKHTIDFPTYEQEETFFEKYNLEPDEQPKLLQEMNIGNGLEEQLSWLDFYEKYK